MRSHPWVTRTSLRLALPACAGLFGLAFAAPALAAFHPFLQVHQARYGPSTASGSEIIIVVPPTDDATAKMTIASPAGYGIALRQVPGTTIGDLTAIVKSEVLGGALLPLSGSVVVANPADPALTMSASLCTGTSAHQAFWLLSGDISNTGRTLQIPVFVDKVGPVLRMQFCLRSPDVPESMGGAPLGTQLVLADFTVNSVFTNPDSNGAYEWSDIATPYVPGGSTQNTVGTVEARGLVPIPYRLTLKRVRSRGTRRLGRNVVKLGGTLVGAGVPIVGVKLEVYAGKETNPVDSGKKVGLTTRTNKGGAYSTTRTVRRRMFFQAHFPSADLACTGPSPTGLPVPCSSESLGVIDSNTIKVNPPPKRKRR